MTSALGLNGPNLWVNNTAREDGVDTLLTMQLKLILYIKKTVLSTAFASKHSSPTTSTKAISSQHPAASMGHTYRVLLFARIKSYVWFEMPSADIWSRFHGVVKFRSHGDPRFTALPRSEWRHFKQPNGPFNMRRWPFVTLRSHKICTSQIVL